MIRAVFFDVDFTLIYPGPAFEGEGYREFCAKHGMSVNADRFPAAVSSASLLLDAAQDTPYTAQLFIDYAAHVIGQMGGRVRPCGRARSYSGPPVGTPALRGRSRRCTCWCSRIRISLISSSTVYRLVSGALRAQGADRCRSLVAEHGFMKPHPKSSGRHSRRG